MIFYKFKPVEQLAHLLDVVVNERLYCEHYEALNDPFEGQFARMVGQGAARPQFGTARELDRNLPTRICSLTDRFEDVRMWSLYAGRFAGVAIALELDPQRLPLHPVRYTRRLPTIDVAASGDAALRALTTKTSHWAYEREWRLLSQDRHIPVPGAVLQVILGMRMPTEIMEIIARVARPHTRVHVARLDPAGTCIVQGDALGVLDRATTGVSAYPSGTRRCAVPDSST